MIDTETTNYQGGTITLLSSELAIENLDESKLQIDGEARKEIDKEMDVSIANMTNVQVTKVGYDTTVANKLSFGALNYKLTGDSDITSSVSLGKALDVNGKALNLYDTLSVAGLSHVGNLNFYIPASANSGYTMMTVNGTADLTGANVEAGVQTGSKLKKDDKITLIDGNMSSVVRPQAP